MSPPSLTSSAFPPRRSTDLTEGVRASARAVASAEAGIRQGAELAGRAVTQHVIPQVQGESRCRLPGAA